ncbi:MAG: hypothetical protein JWR51_3617 [Devosia sp.]|nr:hypothetical protein [Devosia sp.]
MTDLTYIVAVSVLPLSAIIVAAAVFLMTRSDRQPRHHV